MFAAVPCVWVPDLSWWGFSLAMFSLHVSSLLERFGHQGKLCELCIAGIPLQGSELAERWQHPLHVLHWVGERPNRAVLAGGALALTVGVLVDPRLGLSLMLVMLGTGLVWIQRHQRITPWCPWCRRGNGGRGEQAPTAPTSPSMTR
ncbi:hypothetical protein [Nocardiopsis synnemataformans]|uniref:hypothetical protein n=1 Tax=Nocardiopsis synnemataformans TaxID=61305 RepID=UPI003EC07F17